MSHAALTSTTQDFSDLEIRILKLEGAGYPVEMTLDSEQEFPRGHLDPGFLPWVPSSSATQDGKRLFDWLLADNRLKTAWAEVRGRCPQRRIRLRIDAEAPELHTLPWELLRDATAATPQDLAASTATPFSRYLAGIWQPGSPILKRPIKVLVAIPDPKGLAELGLSPINAAAEWAVLQQATAGLEVELVQYPHPSAGFSLETREGDMVQVGGQSKPCTLGGLEAELRQGYHILHIVAHGAYDEANEETLLYLTDDDNYVQVVRDADLADMLARQLADTDVQREDKLRLVFLASCQTATRSSADAFRGLAPQLVAAGVPAVLAMQDLVSASTAQAFTSTFYRRLLQHGLADLAANEARSSLLTAQLPGVAIPVLFQRLRSGELLGQRGHITSDQAELFWPFLMENIERGQCSAFLGPHVNTGLLPGPETVAEELAAKYGYPLPDRSSLSRVAQFMAVHDPDVLRSDYIQLLQRSLFSYLGLKPTKGEKQRFRSASFTDTAEALNWAGQVLQVQENEIHHLLADLPLPLYLTTNMDNFMFEALRHNGRNPRREGLRWQPQAGSPQYVLAPRPSPEQPVVFHLNGHDGDAEQRRHLVLSEDDYLAHFVRLARDQETILPMNVLSEISQHSFVFLGYNINDWEFRVILQGLLKPIAQTGGAKLHVGVQLEVEGNPNADKVIDYLRRYLGRFNIEIYWGTPQQFVAELHAYWHEYLEGEDDGWGF
jgi:hypothetical protein